MTVLEHAILELRTRIRYSYEVSNEEVHDLMDALHNVPQMLREYRGWHVEENIDADLTRYDEKWVPHGDDDGRKPLMQILREARAEDTEQTQSS